MVNAHRVHKSRGFRLSLVGQTQQGVRPMPVYEKHAICHASPTGVERAPLTVTHHAVHKGIKGNGEALIAQLRVRSSRWEAIKA